MNINKSDTLNRLPRRILVIGVKCWLSALPFIAIALVLQFKISAEIGVILANAGTACFGLAILAKLIIYFLPSQYTKSEIENDSHNEN